MKKIILPFIFLLSLSLKINANTLNDNKFGSDSIACITNISLYREFVKQKNFDDAIQPWRKAYAECPRASKNIYIDGAKIYNYLIKKNKGDSDIQKAYLDTLMTIYDQRITHFGKESYVLGLKGSDMIKYSFGDFEQAFTILKQSVEALGQKSKATPLFSYFKAATAKFKAQTLTKPEVLEVYSLVSDYLSQNASIESKSQKFYIKASENVEKLFVPFASCENLVQMFDEKYQSNPDDISLIKRIVKILDKKDCSDAQVYYEAATKLHQSEPSALSAYNMGNLSLKKNKPKEAIGFFNQAIEMTDQEQEKANAYYGLAGAYFKSGRYSTARTNANKAMQINPKWGKPLMLIGEMYVASTEQCGGNTFENAMLYSAALDKFILARNTDSSVADLANKKIASYSKYLPSNEDAFFNGYKEGDTYKIECWIGEPTKVRIK